MKVSIARIEKKEQLFFLSHIIFTVFSALISSFYFRYFAPYYKAIVFFCISLLLLQEVINKKISRKAFAGAVILYLIAVYIIIQSSGALQIAFACLFMFAFGARNVEFKKIALITAWIMFILIAFVVLSSLMGIIQNYVTVNSARTRQYLGFRYALNGPAFMLNGILLMLYSKDNKIKIYSVFLMGVCAFILYQLTDSRLSFWISILALLIALVKKQRNVAFTDRSILPKALVAIYPLCGFGSLLLTILYNPSINWMKNLNAYLGNRLSMGLTSILRFGINALGNPNIEWVGNGLNMYGEKNPNQYLYVDNMYIQILQRYGIVFFIIFLVLCVLLMAGLYKKHEYYLMILLTMVAIHGMIESGLIYLQYNTFWLLFGSVIFSNKLGIRNRRHRERIYTSIP